MRYAQWRGGRAGRGERADPAVLRARGLIGQPPRSSSGYRAYPDQTVQTARYVKRAQERGLTLEEIGELLELAEGGPRECDLARATAEARLAELRHRMADLQRMRDSLAELAATCDRPRPDRRCPLLRALRTDQEGSAMRLEILRYLIARASRCWVVRSRYRRRLARAAGKVGWWCPPPTRRHARWTRPAFSAQRRDDRRHGVVRDAATLAGHGVPRFRQAAGRRRSTLC